MHRCDADPGRSPVRGSGQYCIRTIGLVSVVSTLPEWRLMAGEHEFMKVSKEKQHQREMHFHNKWSLIFVRYGNSVLDLLALLGDKTRYIYNV